jgi:hypothetical protein
MLSPRCDYILLKKVCSHSLTSKRRPSLTGKRAEDKEREEEHKKSHNNMVFVLKMAQQALISY